MRWKNIILTLVLILITSMIYSKKSLNNIEGLRKNAISFSFFGATPILGITYERVLAKKLSLEIGVGLPSIGLGLKVFPRNIHMNKAMFHVGITATYFASQESEMTPGPSVVVYIPIGISYYGKKGFNFGIDLGPGRAYERFIPYGNLKFGYRF